MKPTQEFIDQVLILRCQLRDREAFAELIDRYQGPLRYFVALIVRVFFPGVLEYKPQRVPIFITVLNGLLLLAAIFSRSLYVRSRTLTLHQIQASLAHIEAHLRKMAEKE